MKFKIHVKNDLSEWWESYDENEVTDLDSAIQFGKMITYHWNRTLRTQEQPRSFIEARLSEI